MTVYNSSIDLNADDPDLTMINPSLLYDDSDDQINSYIPIVRRLHEAAHSANNTQNNRTASDNRQDYMYVDHNRKETAEQLEQILNYYRRELKQESNTQLDCSRKLITRLVDLIRPTYSSNKNKTNDLDTLIEDIGESHNKRYIDQKEKIEQLQSEICHLKKLIITSNGDENGNNSMANVHRMNSMIDYEQWMEMEEETKKLHNIVESQCDRINEFFQLTSQGDFVTKSHKETVDNEVQPEKQHTVINLLPSPLRETIDNEIQPEKQHTVINPLRESSNNDTNTIPVTNYEFPTTTKPDSVDHDDKYITTSSDIKPSVSVQPKEYECPNCNQKLSSTDEIHYLQHLSDCFNSDR